MKVAVVQMAPLWKENATQRDEMANINHAIELIKNIKEEVDIVVLPEFAFVGPPSTITDWDSMTESFPKYGLIYEHLKKIASKSYTYILYPFIEKDNEGFYNSLSLVNKEGKIEATYRKIHLFPPEKPYLKPGKDLVKVKLKFGTIGLMTCYDLAFPETARLLALEGVEVILVPTMSMQWLTNLFLKMTIARAIENQVFIVVVNGVGIHPKTKEVVPGHSLVVYPNGDYESLGEKEEVKVYDLDLKLITCFKEKFNTFVDRCPDVYKGIIK